MSDRRHKNMKKRTATKRPYRVVQGRPSAKKQARMARREQEDRESLQYFTEQMEAYDNE